jgi:pyruvate dehydrogenase E1 component
VSWRCGARSNLPDDATFDELLGGSGTQAASTTTAFTRLLRNLCRDERIGPRIVPIIPDEARTFGMDALFRSSASTPSQGQVRAGRPRPAAVVPGVGRRADPRGGHHRGRRTGLVDRRRDLVRHRGVPMVPFFTFYSMFGFQRVGDLIWAAADARARGFLMGATAGRTTLLGEGLQHQDGHSLLLASTVPVCRSLRPGVRLRDRAHHPRRHAPHVRRR